MKSPFKNKDLKKNYTTRKHMHKSNVTFVCYVIWLDKKVKAYPTRIIDTYMKDY